MTGLLKREPRQVAVFEPSDLFSRFDRMFDEWTRSFRFPLLRSAHGWVPEDLIRVDEFQENGERVVRAELPGIDPDKDVTLSVSGQVLYIDAERHEEERSEDKGYVRHEIRSGLFSRTLSLPEGVTESDIAASYKNGILEIRIPVPKPAEARKIPITKS